MPNRRKFLRQTTLGSFGVLTGSLWQSACNAQTLPAYKPGQPMVISTWENEPANAAAWAALKEGKSALDAVEQGVRVPEGDPENQTVGYGGRPDRDGRVTLDACIMDHLGNAGSVCCLEHIRHPISVARKVMEDTPHVILAGAGALEFARAKGFEEEDLLTEASRAEWEEWKKEENYRPIINIENHDTIGMLALGSDGNMAGACTTSGLAYKMHGRVGDSPIIGAGMFVDNEIGGAAATGMGEAVLKTVGSFLVVELMRQGRHPAEACKEAVMRIIKRQAYQDIQIGYIAMNKAGEYGAYCIHEGFDYTVSIDGQHRVLNSKSYMK